MIKLIFILLLNSLSFQAIGKVNFQIEANEYDLDFVRVFYDNKGKNAVFPYDIDKNGVPDQIEDIALQVWLTHQFFCKALDFPDPFKSHRYKNLKYIEVSVLHPNYLKGSNGLAFDELMDSRGQSDKKGEKAIRISVNKNINPVSNLTPSHEMFHLIQNGVTYFKNRWFTEGMARWSELGLGIAKIEKSGVTYADFLRNEKTNKQQLFKLSYTATEFFWNVIAKLDKQSVFVNESKKIEHLKLLRYKNGLPVLRDSDIMGAGIMREVLLELDSQDDIAFRELNYRKWSERNQHSTKNNEFIFRAINKVVKNYLN